MEKKFVKVRSVKDIVDEIIIVDTGSKDNSINIAKKTNMNLKFFIYTPFLYKLYCLSL